MNKDPASLDNLSDIAIPPPVSWWPLAPGWWVVIGIAVLVIAVAAWKMWLRWQANAYRRAALDELGNAKTVSTIAEILKRTALAAFPRVDVASLSGSAWCQRLSDTMGREVPANVVDALTRGVFERTTTVQMDELRDFAAEWITNHRVEDDEQEDAAEASALRDQEVRAC
jgi:hypothetical protein